MGERVLVTGGRDYADAAAVALALEDIHGGWNGISVIIEGCATGADALAEVWAAGYGVPNEHFPADWTKYGRAAGPIRNQQILDEGRPTLVVAFPGGRGTANMVKKARAAGVRVVEVQP